MRKIDRRIVIVGSVILILGIAFGIMRFLQAQKAPPPVRRAIETKRFVKFEPITYSRIEAEVSGPGRLASTAEVDIISEASGKIQSGKVALKKGASFRKGDVLFVVYPDEAKLALKSRKSQYQNTLAGILPDLKVDYPEAEDGFREFFSAIKVDRPLPPLPDLKNEQLNIFLASRNVISEYYSIQRDELSLKRRTVYAPFNGTFKEVYLEAGAYANTGGRVARAIHTGLLELEVPLRRADAAWVQIGDKVHVKSESTGHSWTGRVIRKSQYVDENTQSQEIFIKISDNSKQPLLAGDYLQAVFPVRPIEGVMEIPRNAVFNSDEVFVIKKGRLSKREINIVKTNDRTLLFNGIPEGDSIVVQQLINVSEGTTVQTEMDSKPPAGGPGAAGQGQKAGQSKQAAQGAPDGKANKKDKKAGS